MDSQTVKQRTDGEFSVIKNFESFKHYLILILKEHRLSFLPPPLLPPPSPPTVCGRLILNLHDGAHVKLVEGCQHGVGVLGVLEPAGNLLAHPVHLDPVLGPAESVLQLQEYIRLVATFFFHFHF